MLYNYNLITTLDFIYMLYLVIPICFLFRMSSQVRLSVEPVLLYNPDLYKNNNLLNKISYTRCILYFKIALLKANTIILSIT